MGVCVCGWVFGGRESEKVSKEREGEIERVQNEEGEGVRERKRERERERANQLTDLGTPRKIVGLTSFIVCSREPFSASGCANQQVPAQAMMVKISSSWVAMWLRGR